jgi:hypothetical protein
LPVVEVIVDNVQPRRGRLRSVRGGGAHASEVRLWRCYHQ